MSTKEQSENKEQVSSRRDFIRVSALGVGAVAAAGTAGASIAANSGEAKIPSIKLSTDFISSLEQAPKPGKFEGRGQSGAEVFANLCREEELAGLFCCPGNYTIINALAAAGIPAYGGRSEGSMCAMADGFSRATGEVTATSGTEGPGFTNMIMNIAAANAARTPLLVLASNMQVAGEDREAAIQTVYQQPTTQGMKKITFEAVPLPTIEPCQHQQESQLCKLAGLDINSAKSQPAVGTSAMICTNHQHC